MAKHALTGKDYLFHEKHNAWVICRDISVVHTTGGSWFEREHFNTEEQLINHLNEQYRYNMKVKIRSEVKWWIQRGSACRHIIMFEVCYRFNLKEQSIRDLAMSIIEEELYNNGEQFKADLEEDRFQV